MRFEGIRVPLCANGSASRPPTVPVSGPSLAPHEAALLKNLVSAMIGLLDERESASPSDELEEITGIKTGHSEPPEDPTLRRLLPDFYKSDDDDPLARERPKASTPRCAACTSRRSSRPNVLPRSSYWTRFRTTAAGSS